MSDLQNYSFVRGAGRRVPLPQYTVSFTVNDSTTGAVLYDFTGANALIFPDFVQTLTEAQMDNLVQRAVWFYLENQGIK